MNKTYTITFGDVAENHARMQKIGTLHEKGFTCEQLEELKQKMESEGVECEIVNLSDKWIGEEEVDEATVLVIRKGVHHILQCDSTEELMKEHDALQMDKKAKMRGKVVNKNARWNLCFDEESQEPNYEEGKGRIVAYRDIPMTQKIRETVSTWMKGEMLKGEANYYYDLKNCGIGYHGDGERKKVFAMRMGCPMPIYFQWFQQSAPMGERIKIELNDGDMYAMSEKAVGFDWLKKKVATLRHAAGCDKFTVIKK